MFRIRRKNTMKYEAPKLTALTPAIDAIQTTVVGKSKTQPIHDQVQPGNRNESLMGYADWE